LTANENPVFIARMKTKTSLLTLALCFAAATACLADDPQMGTWKLNTRKSKIAKGTDRNYTVKYEHAFPLRTVVTIDGRDGRGKPMHTEWIGWFNDTFYDVEGDPNSERAYHEVDDRTLNFWVRKSGKIIASGRIVVSADGKRRTVTTVGMNARGRKVRSVAVYNRQ
jgi:hypothetical protein